MTLAEGQVWVYAPFEGTGIEVNYQILALWDDWIWVLVFGARTRTRRPPETMTRSFFEQEELRLKYDVPLRLS